MASYKIILYTYKKLSNGEHPIMLRITHQRKLRYISLGYKTTPQNWDKRFGRFLPSVRGSRQKNSTLNALEERAETILSDFKRKNEPFSFDVFIDTFKGVSISMGVFEFYQMIIDDLNNKNRLGNKEAYCNSMNSVKKFRPRGTLLFSDINYRFLKGYEQFLFKNGCKKGGIHFQMRTFRAVLNEAIRQGYMRQEDYPFSTQFNKKGYSIAHLKPNTQPRALSIEDMEKIKNFPLEDHPQLTNAVYYFLFSYYGRGINFADMARLEWHQIYNGRVSYIRSKTGKLISFRLSPPIENILAHFKGVHATYVFPVLNDFHQKEVQIYNRIKKCLKHYNKDLKEVARILEINVVLTSYVARHTFATTLKYRNANVAMISEALGHSDLATTKAYLKKFDDNVLDSLDELL